MYQTKPLLVFECVFTEICVLLFVCGGLMHTTLCYSEPFLSPTVVRDFTAVKLGPFYDSEL